MINFKLTFILIFAFISVFMVLYPPHALLVAFVYLVWLGFSNGEKWVQVRRVEGEELRRAKAVFNKYGGK